MTLVRVAKVLLPLLIVLGGVASFALADQPSAGGDFVGTTPCDTRSRAFLGGLSSNAPCHCVTWNLTLNTTNPPTRLAGTFTLMAAYGLPGRNDPNQIEDGPTVRLEGTWEVSPGPATNSRAMTYLIRNRTGQSLRLVRLGEHLLHFSDLEGRLMVGNAGWSYTLNRKGIGHEN